MYVCIYIYLCVRVSVCIYLYINTYMCTHVSINNEYTNL